MTDAHDRRLTHAALFYRDQASYLTEILAFACAGMASDEPVFIAVPGDRARMLSERLGDEPGDLVCVDMAEIGHNPARIIPELKSFIDKHAGQRVRCVGESIWPGRPRAEICEATRHEALLNLAFSQTAATILCPYDVTHLAPWIIAGAEHAHPEVYAEGRPGTVARAASPGTIPPECDRPLEPPPAEAETLRYEADLASVRRLVASHACHAGLPAERVTDLIIAASEIAANTFSHAHGGGVLHIWHTNDEILCQLEDGGWITDPLAGRVRHDPEDRGHGLWLVNQVCDLAELRTGPSGTTVRMHMSLR